MHVDAWDEVFIRCPRTAVNALVCDVATWPTWWPGVSVTPAGPAWEVRFRPALRHPMARTITVTVDRVRPRDKGLEFTVGGDLVGTGEWFHLDEPDGVVVNFLLRGQLDRPLSLAWVSTHRAAVRAGMTSLKRRLEQGRRPGAEPDPELLAHQQAELVLYAQEVAQHDDAVAQAVAAGGTPPPGPGNADA